MGLQCRGFSGVDFQIDVPHHAAAWHVASYSVRDQGGSWDRCECTSGALMLAMLVCHRNRQKTIWLILCAVLTWCLCILAFYGEKVSLQRLLWQIYSTSATWQMLHYHTDASLQRTFSLAVIVLAFSLSNCQYNTCAKISQCTVVENNPEDQWTPAVHGPSCGCVPLVKIVQQCTSSHCMSYLQLCILVLFHADGSKTSAFYNPFQAEAGQSLVLIVGVDRRGQPRWPSVWSS